jgi:hypothetical protein
MSMEDFEKRLERQPSKQLPAEWRGAILTAARQACRAGKAGNKEEALSEAFTLKAFLSALLWPCPQAWAGLAVIWVGILGLHISMHDGSANAAKGTPAPAAQIATSMIEERRLLAELLGPNEAQVADKPKPVAPRPQSRRKVGWSLA